MTSIFDYRDHMRSVVDLHLLGQDIIKTAKQQNFISALSRMTPEQKSWWFGSNIPGQLEHLESSPTFLSHQIIAAQAQNPPYGPFESGEVLVTSSGSTGTKKWIPYSLENWLRYIVSCSRGMRSIGIDHTDRILTTDPGGMFTGYQAMEDAAKWICGSQIVIDRGPSLKKKLELIDEHKITVLISNSRKLQRMAMMEPKKYFSHQLKAVIQTGRPLEHQEEIAQAFGVNSVIDYFGASEIGNIYWTCRHGHRHVNDDLINVVRRDNHSYFSNLWSLPAWNYDIGDDIEYSYKGQCACGSWLPTVDYFRPKNYDNIDKQ